jgi:hypothetical protein
MCTIKKNTQGLLISNKGTFLEVNTEKLEYMVISRGQSSRQSDNRK